MARKEGRLLTKKQKEERALAEIRKKALLASGVQIEGLQQGGGDRGKRPVYGNKKKKPGFGGKDDDKESVQASTPGIQSPALTVSDLPEAAPSPVTAPPDSVKSDWDAESEDEKPSQDPEPAKADVKSDWDATSSDEEGKKPKPAPAKAAPTK